MTHRPPPTSPRLVVAGSRDRLRSRWPKTGLAAMCAAIGLAFALVEAAHACSCLRPPTPRGYFDGASLVFRGTVEDLATTDVPGTFPVVATFRVITVWKGTPGEPTVVGTARDSAACGVHFTLGGDYIVYAGRDAETGEAYTSTCSGTRPFDPEHAADLDGWSADRGPVYLPLLWAERTAPQPTDGVAPARDILTAQFTRFPGAVATP